MYDLIFYYKKLEKIGGAERLMMEQFRCAKENGFKCIIVTNEISIEVENFFKERIIIKESLIIKGYLRFILFLFQNKTSKLVCSSGWMDLYLISIFIKIKYNIQLHHPCFMSYNDTDKFSLFQIKNYYYLIINNFEATYFNNILNKISISKKLLYTLRERLNYLSIQKAENIFVLSRHAQHEKKIMYGVTSIIAKGALDISKINKNKEFRVKRNNLRNDRPKQLLTVARLDKNKRIHELIFGLKDYLRMGAHLTIVGSGPEESYLKHITNKLLIDTFISFKGSITDDELDFEYKRADLFVSIDWADFRLTSYESLQFGCPILISSETEKCEIMQKEGWISYVDPNRFAVQKFFKNNITSNQLNYNIRILENYLNSVTWDAYSNKITSKIFI